MNVLVTGGAGYIGSHTVVELIEAGHTPIIVDNYVNSDPSVIDRLEKITGTSIKAYEVDLTDKEALRKIFEAHEFDAVIHFAGLKAVGESVANPLLYYHANICGSLNLLDLMSEYNVNEIVFSSSATVYGDPSKVPITEDESIKPTNPYGHTKAMIEQIINDWALQTTDDGKTFRSATNLRYFNPVGAHKSGLIGENPRGIPNNLLPYVAQVADGTREEVQVFGSDYDTVDGTGVRDYIHVVDLAQAHIAALHRTYKGPIDFLNIGVGKGFSVLEMIQAFEQASGQHIPYKLVDRRPGDIATCYADNSRALSELDGWEPHHSIEQACEDAWRWQQHLKTEGKDD